MTQEASTDGRSWSVIVLVVLLAVGATPAIAAALDTGPMLPGSRLVTAAAGPDHITASRNIEETTISPGGTTTVHVFVLFAEAESRVSVSEEFDPPFAAVAIENISASQANASVIFSAAGSEDLTVALSDVEAGAFVAITYEVTASDTGGGTHDLSGTVVAGNTSVPVTGGSEITVEGPGGNGGDDPAGDAEVVDGGTYYVGQTLYTNAFDPSDSVTLRAGGADGSFVTDVPVDASGTLTLATAGRSPGTYALVAGDGTTITFDLVAQSYDASLSVSSVANAGADTTVDLSIASNRNGYTHVLTSPDFDGAELDSLLPNVAGQPADLDGDGTKEALLLPGGSQQTFTMDFDGVAPGSYTFHLTPNDTSAADSVTVSVTDAAGSGTATFAASSKVIFEHRGDVASIPIHLSNTDQATMYLGSTDLRYRVRLTVTDGDGDGSVTVRWNTHAAGQGDASEAFAAASDADSVTATRLTGQLPGHIAGESYPMNLSVSGTETDVGTVTLEVPSTVTPTLAVRTADGSLAASEVPGRTRPASTIETGDWFVLRLKAAGVAGYLDEPGDLSPPGTEGVSLAVEPTDEGAPGSVDLGAAALYADPATDRFWLIGKPDALGFAGNTSYEATLSFSGNPYLPDSSTAVEFETRGVGDDGGIDVSVESDVPGFGFGLALLALAGALAVVARRRAG